MVAGFDLLVDVLNLSVVANDERPSFRNRSTFVHNSISLRDFFSRVTQDWVVQFKAFRKGCIFFDGVTARCKISNFERFDFFAVRTERQAFFRSATGERFRVPGHNDGLLSFEFRQLVRFPVAAL